MTPEQIDRWLWARIAHDSAKLSDSDKVLFKLATSFNLDDFDEADRILILAGLADKLRDEWSLYHRAMDEIMERAMNLDLDTGARLLRFLIAELRLPIDTMGLRCIDRLSARYSGHIGLAILTPEGRKQYATPNPRWRELFETVKSV